MCSSAAGNAGVAFLTGNDVITAYLLAFVSLASMVYALIIRLLRPTKLKDKGLLKHCYDPMAASMSRAFDPIDSELDIQQLNELIRTPAANMLQNLNPSDYTTYPVSLIPAICRQLQRRRAEQRASLIALLDGPSPGLAAIIESDARSHATVLVIEAALDGGGTTPQDALRLALTTKGAAVAVALWLRSSAARPFWQRFLCTLLPKGVVCHHPEFASAVTLVDWCTLPMAIGDRAGWERCGAGRPDWRRDDEEARTELELAIGLSQLFELFGKIAEACAEDRPRELGRMELCFDAFLDGGKHGDDGRAKVRTWDMEGGVKIPYSLAANIMDCIFEFCHSPMGEGMPECVMEVMQRTPQPQPLCCNKNPSPTPPCHHTLHLVIYQSLPGTLPHATRRQGVRGSAHAQSRERARRRAPAVAVH